MGYDLKKNIELYRLHAENLSEEMAPHQKQYYLDAAAWLKEQNFSSAEEAIAAMRETPFYEGGALAKNADDIHLRIKAMQEVGYDDVAAVHMERKKKFEEQGNGYVFSSAWLEDYRRAGEEAEKYGKRKESFGKIFAAYVEMKGNPQSQHRKQAEETLREELQELKKLGVSFDELAEMPVYRNLTMTTEAGMEKFANFVHQFENGVIPVETTVDSKKEQDDIASWIRANKEQLIAVGKDETWKRANCIVVPASNEEGYEYICKKVVD